MIRGLLEAFNRKSANLPIVAITGGKGGTGKTTVAVNLAVALVDLGSRVLLVDTDVDSPTTAMILGVHAKPLHSVELFLPKIIEDRCTKCGRCAEACRAHALVQITDRYPMLFKELCSGCEACLIVCPDQAIQSGRKTLGQVKKASKNGLTFIGGELKVGEARSAEVVVATKQAAFEEARNGSYDIMVVDTAPGTHCNVVQGLRSADLALAVTEPTPLGIYDLELILRLSSTLGISTKVVMNKATLPGRDVEGVAKVAGKYGTEVAAEIPVDRKLFESYVAGTPTVKAYPDSPAAIAFKNLAHLVSQSVKIAVPAQRHA